MPTQGPRVRRDPHGDRPLSVERCRSILSRHGPDRTWTDDEVRTLRDALALVAAVRLDLPKP